MSSKFKRSALGARVPHEKKTSGMATVAMPLPEKIVLPMQQHIGAPCTPTVKKGDAVLVGTVVGACTGTSTVTTFIESASGVEAGGRTGLTALTTGILFLACIFIAPIAAIIPAAATSAALIYVGILMLQGLKNVDFGDMDQMVPVALMLIGMPISGSIGHAIGLGMISYTVIKLFSGKGKEVSVLTYVISILFLIKFFAVV